MLTKGHTVGPHSICRTICDVYAPKTVSPGSPKAKDSKAPKVYQPGGGFSQTDPDAQGLGYLEAVPST